MTTRQLLTLIFILGNSHLMLAADLEPKESAKPDYQAEELAILYTPPISGLKISSASINMQGAIRDIQLKGFFFRELKQKILYGSEELKSELGLTTDQLTHIRSILDQIDAEDKTQLSQRIELMCEIWNDPDPGLNDQELADKALNFYHQQETLDLTSNLSRRNFFINLTAILGEEKTSAIQQQLANFTRGNTTTPISWSAIVRSIGLEVDQLDFTCSLPANSQTDNR